ncbi:transcription-repair coupling factor [hydrocarbon metagenome]|uniref:Transcription-repair coupling factor n=1 Tax=hydrocarbon metagenome TaxID=938273 RepID=A0A0W8E9U9_9ZZZZ
MNISFMKELNNCLDSRQNVILSGLSGTARAFFLNELFRSRSGQLLCLVATEEKAFDLAQELSQFMDRNRIFMFPGRDYVRTRENYTWAEKERISTLQECILYPHRHRMIIATPGGIMYKLASPPTMKEKVVRLEHGQEIDFEKLLRQLIETGYMRVETIGSPGEFAVRGGVLDIFPVGNKSPYRIELWGDLIESIRPFDLESQRSIDTKTYVDISPAHEYDSHALESTLFDYINEQALLFVDEPRETISNLDQYIKRWQESLKEAGSGDKHLKELALMDSQELMENLSERSAVYHAFFPGSTLSVKAGLLEHISQKEMEYFVNEYERLFKRIKEWQDKRYSIYLYVKSKPARDQLKRDLVDHHISGIEIINKNLDSGFISQTFETALLTEREIWGKKTRVGKKTRRSENRILLENMKLGDYVVHENYGIGIFRGISPVETDGITREYILLQYAGTDRLYLPLDKLGMLYPYNISEEKRPRLSRLGGNDWEKTKSKVSQSIQEMAKKLLELYAARQSLQGYAFSADTPWQQQFEDTFPYQETMDQLSSIKEIKEDMEQSQPMDRLICGDVGYGKTEVAMRAAFKAAMDGKQVAVLVPTTVLAEQHYHTFKDRFKEYPLAIEVLSRFRSASEQKRIVSDLHKGVIDIIIGTHRLLSKDVQFSDLGLLVIDEEHRFGVSQKEKIKMFKNIVDVLSLSATPIPRSLHMSLTGLRDLSVIETPPPERYPIKTYVLEYNEEIITEAIYAEIERKGQVFFVHNRIEDIYAVREKLEALLPEVSIAVGHGRMQEDELSRTISMFLAGEYQVFLCTTIIESGLDMPNVNTIIVDEADRMGLAQLYQLRGRVGRSNRIAYAYLTYKPDKSINELAQKRLNAIREFNELGAGMKIALRDLEIRGAGNILGPEQHGYIQAVGFDMYCRLLERETGRLKGIGKKKDAAPLMDIDVDYYIPDSYIPDSGTKIRIYRRLMLAEEDKEIQEIKGELQDRFGKLPQPVENFLQLSRLRIAASSKEIKSLKRKGNKLEIQLDRTLSKNVTGNIRGIKHSSFHENTISMQFEGSVSLEQLQQVLDVL